MFESNFPVQKRWSSYAVVWNAYKRIAAGASAEEKAATLRWLQGTGPPGLAAAG